MAGNSTSRHTLSADGKLSKIQRLQWLALNLLNNAFPNLQTDGRIRQRKFQVPEERLAELWNKVSREASPSRRLSDLFWLTLPWSEVLPQAGRINALEIGCGSGTYGRLLEEILGEDLGFYLGVDIEEHEHWTRSDSSRLAFAVGRASDSREHMSAANLIFTQSALEHFEEDLLYFRQVSAHVQETRRPVLQVHLVPSAACITTYPWHGIREYTPRTISRITRLFGSETSVYLFSLGGPSCNRVHRKYITWPHFRGGLDLRQALAQEYPENVRSAIVADFKDAATSPAFYALVLVSNFGNDPFAGWQFG